MGIRSPAARESTPRIGPSDRGRRRLSPGDGVGRPPRSQGAGDRRGGRPHPPRPRHEARRGAPAGARRCGRLRARRRRRRVPARLGGRGARARCLEGTRARGARADRRPARVRGRLHVRVQGGQRSRHVRAARAREHDRGQPPAHRHRLAARRLRRGVAPQVDSSPARLRGQGRHRGAPRPPTRDRDRLPHPRNALLADPAAQGSPHALGRGDPRRALRRLRDPHLAYAGRRPDARRSGGALRRAPDRGDGA